MPQPDKPATITQASPVSLKLVIVVALAVIGPLLMASRAEQNIRFEIRQQALGIAALKADMAEGFSELEDAIASRTDDRFTRTDMVRWIQLAVLSNPDGVTFPDLPEPDAQ